MEGRRYNVVDLFRGPIAGTVVRVVVAMKHRLRRSHGLQQRAGQPAGLVVLEAIDLGRGRIRARLLGPGLNLVRRVVRVVEFGQRRASTCLVEDLRQLMITRTRSKVREETVRTIRACDTR